MGECLIHHRARAAQRPPDGDWKTWLVLAGRGFGKTRVGNEWVRHLAETGQARRIALVAATNADVRDTLVMGEAGILAISRPDFMPKYEPSIRKLTWPNGVIATTYTAEEPDRLRGPSHEAALCDELAAWKHERTWDNLMFGLRKGKNPRVCVTTTPKPTTLLKKILKLASTQKTGGNTYENKVHLAESYIEEISAVYENTRLGRQEIYAELLAVMDGVWFVNFDPRRNVTDAAEYDPALPVFVAIDAGVSRHTAAVFFQAREDGPLRHRINVFGDYYAKDQYSEQNAILIRERAIELTRTHRTPFGQIDLVRLDPASTARTGTGPTAFNEYERIFGHGLTKYWPQHLVSDGLDQLELLIGNESKQPQILIHSRCEHLIEAFNQYTRKEVRGEFTDEPKDPNHPHEDLMDALRGGIRDRFPQGRKIRPQFNTVDPRAFFGN